MERPHHAAGDMATQLNTHGFAQHDVVGARSVHSTSWSATSLQCTWPPDCAPRGAHNTLCPAAGGAPKRAQRVVVSDLIALRTAWPPDCAPRGCAQHVVVSDRRFAKVRTARCGQYGSRCLPLSNLTAHPKVCAARCGQCERGSQCARSTLWSGTSCAACQLAIGLRNQRVCTARSLHMQVKKNRGTKHSR